MKNRHEQTQTDSKEIKLIRKDFITVTVLNLLLLGVMIGLYFWNKSSGRLEQLFAKYINF